MARFTLNLAIISVGLSLSACENICSPTDTNQFPTYGEETGLPKNCRAIIAANINSVNAGEFTAEEALLSIDRNCGEFGYSWEQQ